MTKFSYDAPSGGAFTSVAEAAVGCATIRDFVFIMPISDRYSVRWCDIGDPTTWSTPGTDAARAAQAGSQTFPNKFGAVTGIAGNDFFGYIFQERAIWKASYVGGDVVFTFDAFEEGRGCHKVNRLARVDDKVFFESEYGYHMVENDIVVDIGYGAVDDERIPT
jgi:hypothetical protein